ncbi:GFA family protein [Oceanicella sp. SM1341]|uniref:GFA family protein n=1 Tax=Oceanicella sp. SM1341 TaxID=1548889 RepID=UPI000E4D8ED5|nr:GFA family protein [Oceanicella sp. SM1341]
MPVSPDAVPLEGGCACGALRYRLTRVPMFTHCCHCRQCQRLTGSAFVLNTIIEADHIELLSGEVTITAGPSEEGRPHDIHRCAACLTPVWSDYGRRPNYRFVRVGTLDTPGAVAPDAHIFARSRLPWVQLPDPAIVHEIFYELEATWPPEMLARRRAALGG